MSSGSIWDVLAQSAAVVELKGAYLCQDCDGIAAPVNGACPRCGSRSLLGLAAVLNRKEQRGETDDSGASCGDGASVRAHG